MDAGDAKFDPPDAVGLPSYRAEEQNYSTLANKLSYGIFNPSWRPLTMRTLRGRLRFSTSETRPLCAI